MKLPQFKLPQNLDWSIYLIPLVLIIFGIVVIMSITYGTNSTIGYDQIKFAILGFIIAGLLTFFDYRVLKNLYLVFYIIGVILLILVLLLGSKSFGATRWIELGFFRLQPSEIFKMISLITLARFFSEWQEIDWKKALTIITMILGPALLILLQPDLGTASVVFIGLLAILFMSPIKKIYLVIALVILIAFSPVGWHFLKPYQKDRIEAFINPSSDPQGAGYNVNQSKITVGSGGLFGRGLGKGTQSQLNFLPVAHTDFIFAGTAESTGFIGSTLLLLLLGFLVVRAILIAEMARDSFGMYLASSIGIMFLFQILVNVGMNMGIMPVTGIPLPFVSYGGSAMITNMAAIGILQSIYMRHKKIKF